MAHFDYEKYYEHYWEEEHIQRGMDYYDLRYNHIKDFIQPIAGSNVLDVGGGNGQFLEWLGIKKATVLDISASGLKEARQRGYKTVKSDVQGKYPVPENSFDTVICFETIEHIDHPIEMLKQIKKCMKPKGHLILAVPNLPADGIHHKKRWYLADALNAINKANLKVNEIRYTPGFIEKENLDQMLKLKSISKFFIHTAASGIYFLPFSLKVQLAKMIPNRFAMIFVIKATK